MSIVSGLLLGLGSAQAEAAPAEAAPAEAASNAPATPAWARAYAQGQWSVAAGLIETVSEGSRTPWHWLHLARAREKLGQLVEAFAAYERLLEMTPPLDPRRPDHKQREASTGLGEVRRQADAEAEALAQRIPWAQIDLGGEVPPGAYLFVDQQWLTPDRVHSPYPVNPGWHTFLLESDGEVHAARRIHFEEGQNRQVLLRQPLRGAASSSLSGDPAAAGATGVEAGARGSSSELKLSWSKEEPRMVEDTRRANLRLASYISLGIGLVGVGVGTGFTIAAVDKRNELIELADQCSGSTCLSFDSDPERAQALHAEIRHSSAVATLGFVVGGVGLVTGGVLFLLQQGQSAKLAADVAGVELEPVVGLGAAGITGRF